MDPDVPVVTSSFTGLAAAVRETGIPMHRALVVGDTNSMRLYGAPVHAELENVFSEIYDYVLPAGEEHKNLDSIRLLIAALMRHHFDRHDTVFALGGGVVGDMAGFAAAVYLRGIAVVQLPTTLLAQIDSSIGGKTGVDFEGYKNMVGAFKKPVLIFTNSSALKTLPSEQFVSGMGEVIKSALLGDASLYQWLKKNNARITDREDSTLREMIRRTAEIKFGIVRRDPEEHGERALLNLGHTIGHAVEKYKNFAVPHGCCVSLGLIAAAHISRMRGLISEDDENDVRAVCASFGLPVSADGINADEILRITKSDKKMNNGQIRFILLKNLGKAFFTDDVTDRELIDGIRSIM